MLPRIWSPPVAPPLGAQTQTTTPNPFPSSPPPLPSPPTPTPKPSAHPPTPPHWPPTDLQAFTMASSQLRRRGTKLETSAFQPPKLRARLDRWGHPNARNMGRTPQMRVATFRTSSDLPKIFRKSPRGPRCRNPQMARCPTLDRGLGTGCPASCPTP